MNPCAGTTPEFSPSIANKKIQCKSSDRLFLLLRLLRQHQAFAHSESAYIKGLNLIMAGAVPRVTTELTAKDTMSTHVDFVQWIKPMLILFGVLFILNALGLARFGIIELAAFLGIVIVG